MIVTGGWKVPGSHIFRDISYATLPALGRLAIFGLVNRVVDLHTALAVRMTSLSFMQFCNHSGSMYLE